jgi:DNA-binding beta-propeller fold protein YncE
LRELEHEFSDELVVIGVHSAKFPAEKLGENVRKAVLRYELEHPVVNDAEFAVWQAYAVRAWPTLMVIDPRGYVVGRHEGEFSLPAMRDFLHDAIAAFDGEGLIDRTPLQLTPEREQTDTLRFPGKILADQRGERLFIADSGHHRVLVAGLDGSVTQIFGDGAPGLLDGPCDSARFTHPQGMALDEAGTNLYVADTGNHALRAIDLTTGAVTTVAGTGERAHGETGGTGRTTPLASPWDLAWLDGLLWIAMAGTHQLWTFDPSSGRVSLAAGTGHESIHDGPLLSATFAQPSGITALDGVLYVADSETSAIRRVSPAEDRVRRLVGRGLFEFGDVDARADSVRLQHPLGVEATAEDGLPAVYIADSYNNKIKRLDPATREVRTIFGIGDHGLVDGDAEDAEFWEPGGLSLADRRLYVADTNNHAIRIADLDTGDVTTLEITLQ